MSDVPIETLVEHLLAAKRSLSTMTAVVRANEICTTALHAYEESVVLNAETEYLRRGMANQLSVLARVKRSLNRTYDAGKKEFKQLIRMMDAADARMQATTATLRERIVQPEFREGENDGVQRSLLDFVADERVSEVVKALKASVKELQKGCRSDPAARRAQCLHLGVIAEQESHVSDLEPITSQDRADMVKIVVEDASEVEVVVHEINERLAAMENEFSLLGREANHIRRVYAGTQDAFRVLEDIGGKLVIYGAIFTKLEEMDRLREFYQGYAGAYERLILEVDRRRAVEDRVQAIWRKARESVDRLAQEDLQQRENFMQDIGEYIPTDLWPGMNASMKRWEIRPVAEEGMDPQRSTPALSRSVVEGAKARLGAGLSR
ncbi:unnamed protein product [Parascedosporium putredinis]|uniref:Autophagy-related protein 17 n=1 Tax=Parascedosporium putredinis TaxID=1442378 RepID=A0A9P1H8K7_9PEZI|nr:unnamed protein product [Parascedosporium putredinis]CAI8000988.1 unnamed protein product [Parascedosporium putredinis]